MVDLKFTDDRGLGSIPQFPAAGFVKNRESGIGFDGSSIRGFQAIHESDAILKPTATPRSSIRSSRSQPSRSFATVWDPVASAHKDPRNIIKRRSVPRNQSRRWAFFGPEARSSSSTTWSTGTPDTAPVTSSTRSGHWSSSNPDNPTGYTIRPKGYYPRLAERHVWTCGRMACCDGFQHGSRDAAPQSAPPETEIDFGSTPAQTADNLMAFKYVVKNV